MIKLIDLLKEQEPNDQMWNRNFPDDKGEERRQLVKTLQPLIGQYGIKPNEVRTLSFVGNKAKVMKVKKALMAMGVYDKFSVPMAVEPGTWITEYEPQSY